MTRKSYRTIAEQVIEVINSRDEARGALSARTTKYIGCAMFLKQERKGQLIDMLLKNQLPASAKLCKDIKDTLIDDIAYSLELLARIEEVELPF